MKKFWPVTELARDERFTWVHESERVKDPRGNQLAANVGDMRPKEDDAPDRARSLMHGIFMGEVQALEAAGRTCFDFETGTGPDEAPLALKLDMARQCWDEARHVEISIQLADWMGTELGEFGEGRGLYMAGCNPDPACRLTAVNRGIEGLAIDVFANMRTFAQKAGDPVLEFCEDWMLADEVTHVKMGSDWLRRLTADDPERRARALEFQRLVDKIFSGAGRGTNADAARAVRKLAGFTDEDIDEAHVRLPEDEEKEARRSLTVGAYAEAKTAD